MVADVHVVVRTNDEATVETCLGIIRKQISSDHLSVIQEVPFRKAVEKTFELGIKHSKKWTLAVDGDILLKSNAISELLHRANSLDGNFFMIQGRVLDKLLCIARNGGPHLFRTELCSHALSLLPKEDVVRPESYTIDQMVKKGFHRYKGTEVYGLHDFFQYDLDVVKKSYRHGIKFKKMAKFLLGEWGRRLKDDPQYKLALLAYSTGLQKNEYQENDIDFMKAIVSLNTNPKIDYSPDLNSNLVEETFKNFRLSPQARSYQRKNHHDIILRTDQKLPLGSSGSLKSSVLKKLENWAISNQ